MVVRSMIRRTTGFRRRLAMIDYAPSSSITATATVTSQQPLYYYYCSSSKTSFPTTSMIIRIPPGRDSNNNSILEYGYDNLQRQRQQRFFSTTNNNDGDGDGNDGDGSHDVKLSSSSSTYTQLLTEATAKQLQGDVPSAIKLTIQALELMKDDVNVNANANVNDDNENEIAETILFLGKLYQLENQFEKAVKSFEKARDLFDSSSSSGGGLDSSRKKRYFTSITHLAYAQKELGQYNVSEGNYLYSLKGLEIIGGYTDGMTNHTCYELSQLHKAQHKFQKAIDVLETMKMNLSNVFGKTDSKVLQLNSELATLLILLEQQEQSKENPSSSAVIVTTTTANKAVPSSSSSSSSSSSLKNAIDLLEEAMDNLPPNSPEGRRIFMQIDELKEQQQHQQQHQKEDQQQQQPEQQKQQKNLNPGYW